MVKINVGDKTNAQLLALLEEFANDETVRISRNDGSLVVCSIERAIKELRILINDGVKNLPPKIH